MQFITAKNKKGDTKRGFTLIETLVYIVILSLMLVGIVNTLAALTVSYRSVEASRAVESSAIAAMDRIIRETRDATSVNSAQSNFGVNLVTSSSSAFTLNGLDASSTAVTIQFYVQGNRIMLKENGISLGPITASNVSVSNLVFRSYSTTTSAAVKVEMSLDTASTSAITTTENFYGTAVLRGSY